MSSEFGNLIVVLVQPPNSWVDFYQPTNKYFLWQPDYKKWKRDTTHIKFTDIDNGDDTRIVLCTHNQEMYLEICDASLELELEVVTAMKLHESKQEEAFPID